MNNQNPDRPFSAGSGFGGLNLARACWNALLAQTGALPGTTGSVSALTAVADTTLQLTGTGRKKIHMLDLIVDRGWLLAALPSELGGIQLGAGGDLCRESLEAIVWLARANVSTAQKFSTHVHAVRLLQGFGNAEQLGLLQKITLDGGMVDVLDETENRYISLSDDAAMLQGRLPGFVPHARTSALIVRAHWRGHEQLCFVDLTLVPPGGREGDALRTVNESVNGRELVLDSRCCFSRLGEPGCARREPWFRGGEWRSAAVMLGAVYRYLDQVRDCLEESAPIDSRTTANLLPVIATAMGVQRLIADAAWFADGVEGEHSPLDAVVYSRCARSLTHDAAQRALRVVASELKRHRIEISAPLQESREQLQSMLSETPPLSSVSRAFDHLVRQAASLSELDPARRGYRSD